MKLLYFAWFRERVGLAEETLDRPPGVVDVESLLGWLEARGGGHALALSDRAMVRVAVNHDYADLDTPVGADDEVALFPPVTGG